MNHPEITWNPYFPSSFPMFCVSPLFPYFSWSMVNPRLRYNRYPRLPQFHGSRKTPSQYIGLIHAKDCSGSFISLCISIYLSESIYLWIYFSVYLSIDLSMHLYISTYERFSILMDLPFKDPYIEIDPIRWGTHLSAIDQPLSGDPSGFEFVREKRRAPQVKCWEWGLLGLSFRIIIYNHYGSFPHSLLSTLSLIIIMDQETSFPICLAPVSVMHQTMKPRVNIKTKKTKNH